MSGRHASRAILAWAALLAVLAALLPALGGTDDVALSQLPLAAAGTVVLAVVAARLVDRGMYEERHASVGAPAVAVAVVLMVAGAAVGLWLVLAAVPLLAAGIVALVLETRG
jgi:drug/metabolite transporter (DMT)-like permease